MQGNPSKTNLSEKQAETKAWETCRNGRPETIQKRDKENGKTRQNVSRYHDALMRQNPFHPPTAKKY
tara:strand:+ start:3825 stop:4025 length:201 start_codon:yes stop_codon:yes gene_type:complete